ncbi:MAG: glycosyltransferase [bacterium]|nr:glycosyltransferase [bacterium]
MNEPHLSVCIPTYEMKGLGAQFLRESFDILLQQTFKDFEVVISDNSKTDVIKKVCDEYKDKLDIHYYPNPDPIKEMAQNFNNVIKSAKGRLIKILLQDDFLYDARSLEHVVSNFDLERDHWLVTACEHSKDGKTFYRPFYPTYNHDIIFGRNTISSPSVLTIKNESPLLFDTHLKWYIDCDYYKRYYDAFGEPKIVNEISVVNRTGEHQTSSFLATTIKEKEFAYMMKKYNVPDANRIVFLRKAKKYLLVLPLFIKKTIRTITQPKRV